MAKVRAYRNPIIYVVIAVALVAALLLLYLTPLGDSPAAGKRIVRNFDENVQLTASSGITVTFKAKGGSCSAQKCGQFQGTVTSPDSRCVGGRNVTITGPNGFTTTAVTDATGSYSTGQLTGLSGTYTATVQASSGYGFTCDAASATVTV
jgi:hypothetical protein